MRPNEPALESWKEIAAYIQRDARTARKWEQEEGLPVHRHSHKARASVYAYPSEIDAWRESRKVLPEAPAPAPLWKTLFGTRRSWAFGITMAMCLVIAGNGFRPQRAEAASPVLRSLCESCVDISDGGLSRDGHFAIGTDWSKNDLVIQDLRSGKRRYLGVRAATDSPSAWPEYATFSRDARQIAYLWSVGDDMELRVIENKSGAKPRILLKGFPDLNGLDWHPDGRRLLVMLEEKEDEDKLVWVTVADGSVQTLKDFGKRLKQYPKVSPDGRFIAYAAIPAENHASKNQRIYLLSADGRTETEIVHAAGVNRNPVWAPDGSQLLFMSDRTGKNSLWSIRVAAGKAAGSEKLLKADLDNNTVAWDVTPDGSYIFQTRTTPLTSASIIAMDRGGNRIQGTTPQVLESFVGTNPTWSPDGRKLAFTRVLNGKELTSGNYLYGNQVFNSLNLIVRDVATGNEQAFTQEGISADPARWFPDGKSLMKNGNLPGSPDRVLYRVDVASGEFSILARLGQDFAGEGEISADGKTVFLAGRGSEGMYGRLMALDVATGTWRLLYTFPAARNIPKIILHPDGSRLLLRIQVGRTSHFGIIGVDGTGYRQIYQTDVQVTGVGWTRDGTGVLFAERPASVWRVMRIPVAGGQPEPIGLDLDSAESRALFHLSPDGTKLAASSRQLVWEIWALEHVVAGGK